MQTITEESREYCIAINNVTHGKWRYLAATVYEADYLKDGTPVWKRNRILTEATTWKKIMRLAEQLSKDLNYPLIPEVRHNSLRSLTNTKLKGVEFIDL